MSNVKKIFSSEITSSIKNEPIKTTDIIHKLVSLYSLDSKMELESSECAILHSPDFMKFVGFAISHFDNPSSAVEKFFLISIDMRQKLVIKLKSAKDFIKECIKFFESKKIMIVKMKTHIDEKIMNQIIDHMSIEMLVHCVGECMEIITAFKLLAEDKKLELDMGEFEIGDYSKIGKASTYSPDSPRRTRPTSPSRAASPRRQSKVSSPMSERELFSNSNSQTNSRSSSTRSPQATRRDTNAPGAPVKKPFNRNSTDDSDSSDDSN